MDTNFTNQTPRQRARTLAEAATWVQNADPEFTSWTGQDIIKHDIEVHPSTFYRLDTDKSLTWESEDGFFSDDIVSAMTDACEKFLVANRDEYARLLDKDIADHNARIRAVGESETPKALHDALWAMFPEDEDECREERYRWGYVTEAVVGRFEQDYGIDDVREMVDRLAFPWGDDENREVTNEEMAFVGRLAYRLAVENHKVPEVAVQALEVARAV